MNRGSLTGIPQNIYPNIFYHQIFFILLPRTITILPYFSKEALVRGTDNRRFHAFFVCDKCYQKFNRYYVE